MHGQTIIIFGRISFNFAKKHVGLRRRGSRGGRCVGGVAGGSGDRERVGGGGDIKSPWKCVIPVVCVKTGKGM